MDCSRRTKSQCSGLAIPLIECGNDSGSIFQDERPHIQPESGKGRAAQDTLIFSPRNIFIIVELPRIDFSILRAPHDVLIHSCAPISVQFLIGVQRHAAGRHLHDQFRGADKITLLVHCGASSVLG
jgi:hypothetical protein